MRMLQRLTVLPRGPKLTLQSYASLKHRREGLGGEQRAAEEEPLDLAGKENNLFSLRGSPSSESVGLTNKHKLP